MVVVVDASVVVADAAAVDAVVVVGSLSGSDTAGAVTQPHRAQSSASESKKAIKRECFMIDPLFPVSAAPMPRGIGAARVLLLVIDVFLKPWHGLVVIDDRRVNVVKGNGQIFGEHMIMSGMAIGRAGRIQNETIPEISR